MAGGIGSIDVAAAIYSKQSKIFNVLARGAMLFDVVVVHNMRSRQKSVI